jgi:hypothetical protein
MQGGHYEVEVTYPVAIFENAKLMLLHYTFLHHQLLL